MTKHADFTSDQDFLIMVAAPGTLAAQARSWGKTADSVRYRRSTLKAEALSPKPPKPLKLDAKVKFVKMYAANKEINKTEACEELDVAPATLSKYLKRRKITWVY